MLGSKFTLQLARMAEARLSLAVNHVEERQSESLLNEAPETKCSVDGRDPSA